MVLPVALLGVLWVHTLRVARVVLLPPRRLTLWVLGLLLALALVWPMGMMPKADPLTVPGAVEVDWFYNVWLLLARNAPPPVTLGVIAAFALMLLAAPWWWRPVRRERPQPSVSNELLCTGCTQCYQDCPYDAIAMVPAPPENTATVLVARVDPALCVSCGICAGSCAPMVIGPPNRAGGDHLQAVRAFHQAVQPGPTDVVLMACEQGVQAGRLPGPEQGVYPYALHCSGAMHTSAIEYLLRRGVGGVYVLGCAPRDCVNREGPKWMAQRLFEDREAELHARADKRRVRLGAFARAEWSEALADVQAFQQRVRELSGAVDEGEVRVEPVCEVMEAAGD
jgi:ferredoxin